MRGLVVWDRGARRVWLCSLRCHHGLTGCALLAFGALVLGDGWRAAAAAAGLALAAHDRRDFPWTPTRRIE